MTKMSMVLLAALLASCAMVGQPTERDFQLNNNKRCTDACAAEFEQCRAGCAVAEDREACEQGCTRLAAQCVQACPQVTANEPLNALP